ncbi:MAG: glycerophosphodiester phosphodiesterase family protein [Myxococcales bacterium]|jgi:glycerophosphoryl diester phosphodiesterase|nr:glycerophosphodiester phosphodiesterase family protein [Myxococcales bacterium]
MSFLAIAHRGASGRAPENTHAAFAAALALGAGAIELDCQLSADGELVVIHDETLDRTTDGRGPVGDRTWQELARLDAGSWFAAAYAGERIPRLAEVIEQVRRRALLNVEIKSARDLGRIEAKLIALVLDMDATREVVFSSFHWEALRRLRAAAPWARLGVLCDDDPRRGGLGLAVELRGEAVIPGRRWIDGHVVAEAHARGLGVWVWTVNEPGEMRRLLALGVDAIFSDWPERLVDLARFSAP